MVISAPVKDNVHNALEKYYGFDPFLQVAKASFVLPLCPGWPPCFRLLFVLALTFFIPGGSDAGKRDEGDEFLINAAIHCSS